MLIQSTECPYPQELVLQLQDGLCRLTQVQLLSHQSCITTKIELFVSQTLLYEGDTTKFSRLGFLTLKANTESKYMARELKTVHIDHEAALLKLRIHACHVNEHNLHNQVGIMTITLCGEHLAYCRATQETRYLKRHCHKKSIHQTI
ncbi:hypothetical protein Plhal304r1_c027g0091611 [Plasmopara halstedii]